ncbi:DUF6338 family protein [Candidatus Poriferisodalis sp.]|uniref:DUF6338 family protein n=1 Tax=Candidatus Poriferisodalis sp. TaxID=3101277 RepID=UPI003B022E7A
MLPEFESITRSAAVAFALLVPGASAAAGFEWHSVRYSRRRKDWVLRLLLFSGLWLGAGFWLWHSLAVDHWDDLVARKPLPWFVYAVPLGFVVVPYGLGWALGWMTSAFPRGMRKVLGGNRTPTAWDHLFDHGTAGSVRCRLRSGRWVGGSYEETGQIDSFASADDTMVDVYISKAVEYDQDSGAPLLRDGEPAWTGGGLLLRWDEIESLEFIPEPSDESEAAESNDEGHRRRRWTRKGAAPSA